MSCITWKPIAYGYYAYLETTVYDQVKKGSTTKSFYLGSTLDKAEEKLKKLVQDQDQLTHLLDELYRKRPAGKPPQDELSKAIKALKRLSDRFKDERIKVVLKEAVTKLERGRRDARQDNKKRG